MISLNDAVLDSWVDDPRGPVALHMREELVPVEVGDDFDMGKSVIFPPTYAKKNDQDSPYNIDRLEDGTRVALIDSVGSQANRMEPLFMAGGQGSEDLARLVPQWWIEIPPAQGGSKRANEKLIVNLLSVGHRLGDALVRSTSLRESARKAFLLYLNHGDASGIAKLAPTSLVFGVWDSRETQAKFPRVVSSVIRAWDISELKRSAQYFPPINYAEQGVFDDAIREAAEKNPKSKQAKRGMVAVPAVETHGGIVVRGGIFRDVTVNLTALRQIKGGEDDGVALRRYILGLALLAATEPAEAYLRQGCLVVPKEGQSRPWQLTHRTGVREQVSFDLELLQYASAKANTFGIEKGGCIGFEAKLAEQDLEETGADKGSRGKNKAKRPSAEPADGSED